ncbi:DUF6522 family protein [Ensifer sp. BR816]|uniref:DUF6522 family protein n=1 Tax=Rhizobium sp. (strain BR816) TaxID=1057002 RepID=UPI0003647887|nr:DUF6522 family protein [Ensifer sp. BR816]
MERDNSGDFILDPAMLADRFRLSMNDLRRNFKMGLLTSMVERGEGQDAGTCRLSVKLGNRIWRAVLNSEDRIVSEEVTFLRTTARTANAPANEPVSNRS